MSKRTRYFVAGKPILYSQKVHVPADVSELRLADDPIFEKPKANLPNVAASGYSGAKNDRSDRTTNKKFWCRLDLAASFDNPKSAQSPTGVHPASRIFEALVTGFSHAFQEYMQQDQTEVDVCLNYRSSVCVGDTGHSCGGGYILKMEAIVMGYIEGSVGKNPVDMVLGNLKFYIIRVGNASNDRVHLHAVFDAFQETVDVGNAIYDDVQKNYVVLLLVVPLNAINKLAPFLGTCFARENGEAITLELP